MHHSGARGHLEVKWGTCITLRLYGTSGSRQRALEGAGKGHLKVKWAHASFES